MAGLYRCGWLYSMTAKSDTNVNLWKPEWGTHTRRRRVTATCAAQRMEFGKKRVKHGDNKYESDEGQYQGGCS